jgi:hypothetical protein
MLNIKSQISINVKLKEIIPIRKMPIAHNRFANPASLREHKKNKRADTNTTRNPGISLGISRNPLCRFDRLNVSFKKLLNVESTML